MFASTLLFYLAIAAAKFCRLWIIILRAEANGFQVNGKRELFTRTVISSFLWPYTLTCNIYASYQKGK